MLPLHPQDANAGRRLAPDLRRLPTRLAAYNQPRTAPLLTASRLHRRLPDEPAVEQAVDAGKYMRPGVRQLKPTVAAHSPSLGGALSSSVNARSHQ